METLDASRNVRAQGMAGPVDVGAEEEAWVLSTAQLHHLAPETVGRMLQTARERSGSTEVAMEAVKAALQAAGEDGAEEVAARLRWAPAQLTARFGVRGAKAVYRPVTAQVAQGRAGG